MRGLFQLRYQVIMNNKEYLGLIIIPIIFNIIYLYDFNSVPELSSMLLFTVINFTLSATVGPLVSLNVASDKEYKMLHSIRVIGITDKEYMMSILTLPMMIGLFAVIIYPFLITLNHSLNLLTYMMISLLTLMSYVLFYLVVALLTKNLNQNNTISGLSFLVFLLLPLLSATSEVGSIINQIIPNFLLFDYLINEHVALNNLLIHLVVMMVLLKGIHYSYNRVG